MNAVILNIFLWMWPMILVKSWKFYDPGARPLTAKSTILKRMHRFQPSGIYRIIWLKIELLLTGIHAFSLLRPWAPALQPWKTAPISAKGIWHYWTMICFFLNWNVSSANGAGTTWISPGKASASCWRIPPGTPFIFHRHGLTLMDLMALCSCSRWPPHCSKVIATIITTIKNGNILNHAWNCGN